MKFTAGEAEVFLSERARDAEVWNIYQVPEFSRDHRVIIHAYRGAGRSGKPSVDCTTKMFCDDLVALLDQHDAEDAIMLGGLR